MFCIIVMTKCLTPDMVTGLRAVHAPAVLQYGGDYTLILTKHGEKIGGLREFLMRTCGLDPTSDFLVLAEVA